MCLFSTGLNVKVVCETNGGLVVVACMAVKDPLEARPACDLLFNSRDWDLRGTTCTNGPSIASC